MQAIETKPPLPAYRVFLANGESYVTSMARNITLDKARAYFIGASIDRTIDGGPEIFSRCTDVQPVN
jgi:hypothetical protein